METGSRQKNHAYQESEKADRRHIRQTACKVTALAAAAVLGILFMLFRPQKQLKKWKLETAAE